MSKSVAVTLFVCVAIAQIAVPAKMIVDRERVLSKGDAFRFETRPLDPFDPFRGRYVIVSLAETSAPLPANTTIEPGQKVYAHISEDIDGRAFFDAVTPTPPDGPYMTVTASWIDLQQGHVELDIPIDRYYMNEAMAPAAEQAYFSATRDPEKGAEIAVRVLDGYAVIEGLFIDDTPIEEYVRRQMETGAV